MLKTAEERNKDQSRGNRPNPLKTHLGFGPKEEGASANSHSRPRSSQSFKITSSQKNNNSTGLRDEQSLKMKGGPLQTPTSNYNSTMSDEPSNSVKSSVGGSAYMEGKSKSHTQMTSLTNLVEGKTLSGSSSSKELPFNQNSAIEDASLARRGYSPSSNCSS